MKRLAVLAVAGWVSVTASASTSASNWVFISKDDYLNTLYVDADSISGSGRYKEAFAKVNLYNVQTDSGLRWDSRTALYRIDCRSKPTQFQVLSRIAHLNNRVVHRDSGTYPSWRPVYPGSISEQMANFICSH